MKGNCVFLQSNSTCLLKRIVDSQRKKNLAPEIIVVTVICSCAANITLLPSLSQQSLSTQNGKTNKPSTNYSNRQLKDTMQDRGIQLPQSTTSQSVLGTSCGRSSIQGLKLKYSSIDFLSSFTSLFYN